MLSVISILFLFLIATVILFVRVFRPKFQYFWLIAALGAILTWVMLLLIRPSLPEGKTLVISLITWRPVELFLISPVFQLDMISWSYGLALVTLLLGVIFTDVARANRGDWISWISCLVMTALGLVSVFSGNLLTLVLAWAAIDLMELFILLARRAADLNVDRVVTTFGARAIGILLVMIAGMIGQSSGAPLSFTSISPKINVLLLAAAGLRLGILPAQLSLNLGTASQRGLEILMRLVPVASSLVLLPRAAAAGVDPGLFLSLIGLLGITALLSSLSWVFSQDEQSGQIYWVLGLAAFSMASALRTQPAASLAWGMAALLSGGVIFLYSVRARFLNLVWGFSLLAIVTLPFLPGWQGIRLYTPDFSPALGLFLLAQAVLVGGYIRHAMKREHTLSGVERWVWLIYTLGLIIFPISQIIITWWVPDVGSNVSEILSGWRLFWPALVVLGLVTAGGLWVRLRSAWRLHSAGRSSRFSLDFLQPIWQPIWQPIRQPVRGILSLDWIYHLAGQVFLNLFRALSKAVVFMNIILEGEGGFLWTLLMLTLLLSIVVQSVGGG